MSASIAFIQKLPVVDFWVELIHFFGEIPERSHHPTPKLAKFS
jgi:hypothetical protein